MHRSLAKALCASVAAVTAATATLPSPAVADAMLSESAPSRVISVPKDKSLSFRLDEPATKIVVAQPDIAEVVATTDRSFYVRGVAPGATNLLVYGPGSRLMEVIDVNVGFDGAILQRDLATAFPGEDIHVQSLGQGLLLTGTASTASVAKRALDMAQKFAPDSAASSLLVRSSQEVVLEVRVMEASRSALQDIGFSGAIGSTNTTANWGSGLIGNVPANGIISWTNRLGGFSVNAQVQALEEKGVVHTLAKPTLVAVSGGKASFLAGGEFPYPVPQQAAVGANTSLITIDFREYGVKLKFEPLVQDNGLLRLAIAPEVSQLDQANAIKIGGVQIPGLITRKADTTVEISDGDSLAIGGLFQHNYTNDLRQFPVLSSIPVLGPLFRSARWNRGETELIIIVTPHIVTARDFNQAKRTASIGETEPHAFDFVFNGNSFEKPMNRDMRTPETLTGQPRAAATPEPARPQAVTRAAPTPSAPVQAVAKAAAPVVAPPAPKPAAPAPLPVQASAKAAPAAAPAETVAKAALPTAAAPPLPAKAAPAAPAPQTVAIAIPPPAPLKIPALTPAAPAVAKADPAPAPAPIQLAVAATLLPAPIAKAALLPAAAPAEAMATAGHDAVPPTRAPQLRGEIAPKAASTGK